MKQKRLTSIISLVIGIAIFGIIFWYLGPESLQVLFKQSNLIYLIPFAIFATLGICSLAFKLKYILKTHKYNLPFLKVLKYTVAGFAISYVTPTARIGGEPLKTYMMKKEYNVPLKIGGSSVVIDKFVELFAAAIVAIFGLFLLFLIPGVSTTIKFILFALIIFVLLLLFFIYYWTIKGKGPFTKLFNLLRFYKLKKFQKASKLIKEIEEKMAKFFIHHKKEFFISFLIYGFSILFGILEFKFLLLTLGIKASLMEIILAHMVLVIATFIPVPAGLGFQEAGHSGLFALLRNSGSLGLMFSLMVRLRFLIITGIGFIIITNFTSNEITKKYYKKSNNLKTK